MGTIADLCGVSHATVSNVLRCKNLTRFSSPLRAEILRCAVRIGYGTRPDQRLDADRRRIAFIFLDLRSAFRGTRFFQLLALELKSIESEHRFDFQIFATERADLDATLYKAVCENRCHAAVLFRYGTAEMVNELAARLPIPLVYAESTEGLNCFSCGIDNFGVGRSAAEHLYDQGYRSFISFGGASLGGGTRLGGFIEGLRSRGVREAEVRIFEDALDFEGGARMAARLMSAPPVQPTGIFCHFDDIAFGALQAFHDAGFPIERRIGVVGSDNSEFGTYSHPSLTTLELDAGRNARALIDLLKLAFEGAKAEHWCISPQLIVRQSSLPPGEGARDEDGVGRRDGFDKGDAPDARSGPLTPERGLQATAAPARLTENQQEG